MKGAKIQKPWIDTLFRGRKVAKLLTYLKFELNIDFIHQGVFLRMYKDTFFKCENHNNYSRKFWDNSKCKCDQGKATLERIISVCKIIHKEIYIKVHGLRGWALVCASVSLSILRSTIATSACSSNLETHTTQNFPMIALRSVAKLSTSPKVTIFPPPVPYPFISYHCLKVTVELLCSWEIR